MQKFNRALIICTLSLVAVLFTFLVPSVSYAHSLSPQPHPKSIIMVSVISQGHKQISNVALGQEIVVPSKNGGSIHFKMDFFPAKGNTAIKNNAGIPINGCGTTVATTQYSNFFGVVLMSYTLKDFFCNNGVAVTYQGPAIDSAGSVFGITLSSHSKDTGWIQKPWSAYALGYYTFLTGIPTPWGGIGASCEGSIQTNMVGDGPYFNYFTECH